MLSVSLMLGQIYGFCPVLLRLSTTMPEHEYSERMIFVCQCGFDYSKRARFGRSVVCSWRVRCVLNAHPKIWQRRHKPESKTKSNVPNFGRKRT